MKALEIVAATTEPAFAIGEGGEIVTWNEAAERLLGYRPAQVVGRRCYEVLCGVDLAGNPFCGEECSWVRAARQADPVADFELIVRNARGCCTPVRVSAIVVPTDEGGKLCVVHLLDPLSPAAGATGSERAPGGTGGGEPTSPSGTTPQPPGASRLTPREREVLALMITGARTREIAARLAVTSPTVRNHVQRILRKLGVHSRRDAVTIARRSRLG